jgi:hypothetical protein
MKPSISSIRQPVQYFATVAPTVAEKTSDSASYQLRDFFESLDTSVFLRLTSKPQLIMREYERQEKRLLMRPDDER